MIGLGRAARSLAAYVGMGTVGIALSFVSVRLAYAVEGPATGDIALPCRPTIACTTDLVPPGTFEVEGGYLLRDSPGDVYQQSVPLLLKFTLTPLVQLQVASNGPIIQRRLVRRQYLDDIEIGSKLRFNDQSKALPGFAVSGSLSIPTFPSTNYLRTYDLLFTGYATKDIGWVHADLNLGINVWRVQSPLTQGWVALALSAVATPLVSGMVEVYYFSDSNPIASSDGGVLMALALTPVSWLVMDIGADVGLVRETREFSVFIGFTMIPAVFWRSASEQGIRSQAVDR